MTEFMPSLSVNFEPSKTTTDDVVTWSSRNGSLKAECFRIIGRLISPFWRLMTCLKMAPLM